MVHIPFKVSGFFQSQIFQLSMKMIVIVLRTIISLDNWKIWHPKKGNGAQKNVPILKSTDIAEVGLDPRGGIFKIQL